MTTEQGEPTHKQAPKARDPWALRNVGNTDKRIVHALRALNTGAASPEQQKAALQFIVEELACTYDLSYRPDSPHNTSFAEGKRSVGLQLVALLKQPMNQ